MEFKILGPLEVVSDGGPLEVRGAKPRALLALLLVHANTVVAPDRLIEDLWDGTPPKTAMATLQTYVSQLRRALPLESLRTRPGGYVLEVTDAELDALRFERAVHAIARVDESPPAWPAARLSDALALWRGRALSDFEDAAWAQAEATRLEGLRLGAVESLMEARLDLGEHTELVSELESLVVDHPFRERLWAQLMLALYRCSRQADALRTYAQLRSHLGEELGIEPTRELAALEEAILLQKPELDWQPPAAAPPTARLPSGSVTFLFTAVDSAAITRGYPAGQQPSAAALYDLVDSAIGDHGGLVVKSTEDGLMAAFDDAESAAAAAIDAQQSVVGHDPHAPVGVRTGIHTGSARAESGTYHGQVVERAARVAAAAHPGQILVTAATSALLEDCPLRDLGKHRLPGTPPIRLHQVMASGLSVEFPPLTTASVPVDLPSQPTTLVGRDGDLEVVAELLSEHRLVTLTGLGGCGKTRLAIETADRLAGRFSDGVRFADLAAVSHDTQVAGVVVQALGLVDDGGASEPVARLTAYFADRELLCVLDNCEHLLDGCAKLGEAIVSRSGPSRLLATSRESLGAIGEHVYVVPPLDADTDAVHLFADRAAAVRAGFTVHPDNREVIASICRRLDGIPLAIELAAARTAHLSPMQILDHLDDRLRLLTGGRRTFPRHQTLAATLDWSYDLLNPQEQLVLARLAVFPASFSLDAVEAVAGPGHVVQTLGSLVAKSLVQVVESPDQMRYRLLETVRVYAESKLDASGEATTRRPRHRDWVLDWLESMPLGQRWFGYTDHLEIEQANIRAALEWSASAGEPEALARLVASVEWSRSEAWQEGLRWCETAVANVDSLPTDLQAQLYLTLFRVTRITIGGSNDWAQRAAWVERAIDACAGEPSPLHAEALCSRALGSAVFAAGSGDEALASQAAEWAEAGVAMSEHVEVPWHADCRLLSGQTYVVLELISPRHRDRAGDHFAAAVDAVPTSAQYRHLRALTRAHLALYRAVTGDVAGALPLVRELQADDGLELVGRADPTPLALAVALPAANGGGDALRELRAYDEAARRADRPDRLETVAFYGGIRAALREDWEKAARLLAAGETTMFRASYSAQLYVMFRERARAALGPERSRKLRAEGRAMSLADARDAALR